MAGRGTAVIHINPNREVFSHFCVLKNFIILSMFRHDYRVALFLSWSIVVRVASSDVGVV